MFRLVIPLFLGLLILAPFAAVAQAAAPPAAGSRPASPAAPEPAASEPGMQAPRDEVEGQPAARSAIVIPVRGEIDRSLTVFLRRYIRDAAARESELIVLVIDTFGGRVDSALQIATLIGSVDSRRTVAYIPATPEGTGVSWSAGALIAMSAGRIFMAPGTSVGAAAPVYATGGGMEAAPEKEVSAVRAQMAALAEKNGYPVGVALAMVDADVELLEVYLGGKLAVATSEEMPALERQARQENLTLEKGRVISPKGKLLTLTAGEAERYGVSSGTVAALEGLLERLEVPAGQMTAVEESAADRLVAFVTGSAVTAILVLAGLVALYIEITTPGFGLPGTVALICFGVVFLGGALLGTVGSLELLIFLAGLTLLLVEVFLIPGFGITGITGILAMAYALVFSRLDFAWPRFTWQWDQLYRGLLWAAASVAGSVLAVALLYRYFPRIAPFRRLFLTSSQDHRQGYTVQEESVGWKLVGRQGVATSPLRPAGKAQIDGEPVDVVTDGEFLPAGTPVEVAEVSGNRIVVRRVRE